jgi:hypothetical protein
MPVEGSGMLDPSGWIWGGVGFLLVVPLASEVGVGNDEGS